MELWAFSSQFAIGIVGYARTTITHDYFIAITFVGSLGRYLNTRPSSIVFNSFLGTRQMLMHEKLWVIPILVSKYPENFVKIKIVLGGTRKFVFKKKKKKKKEKKKKSKSFFQYYNKGS